MWSDLNNSFTFAFSKKLHAEKVHANNSTSPHMLPHYTLWNLNVQLHNFSFMLATMLNVKRYFRFSITNLELFLFDGFTLSLVFFPWVLLTSFDVTAIFRVIACWTFGAHWTTHHWPIDASINQWHAWLEARACAEGRHFGNKQINQTHKK